SACSSNLCAAWASGRTCSPRPRRPPRLRQGRPPATDPRILVIPMTMRSPFLRNLVGAAVLLCATGAVLAPDAAAQPRRARLSEALRARLRRGEPTGTRVIVSGTPAQIDAIATRHGVRVRRRLQAGAVLDVPAGRLAGLAEDPAVDQMAADQVVRSHMA